MFFSPFWRKYFSLFSIGFLSAVVVFKFAAYGERGAKFVSNKFKFSSWEKMRSANSSLLMATSCLLLSAIALWTKHCASSKERPRPILFPYLCKSWAVIKPLLSGSYWLNILSRLVLEAYLLLKAFRASLTLYSSTLPTRLLPPLVFTDLVWFLKSLSCTLGSMVD